MVNFSGDSDSGGEDSGSDSDSDSGGSKCLYIRLMQSLFAFGALTLMARRQEEHPAFKT